MQKQGTQLFPRGVPDPLMYLGVSRGQPRAIAATWIVFLLVCPYLTIPILS